MMQRKSAHINHVKIPKDTDNPLPQLLSRATSDMINKGVVTDGKQGTIQNVILADENILADFWTHLN